MSENRVHALQTALTYSSVAGNLLNPSAIIEVAGLFEEYLTNGVKAPAGATIEKPAKPAKPAKPVVTEKPTEEPTVEPAPKAEPAKAAPAKPAPKKEEPKLDPRGACSAAALGLVKAHSAGMAGNKALKAVLKHFGVEQVKALPEDALSIVTEACTQLAKLTLEGEGDEAASWLVARADELTTEAMV